MLNSEEIFFLSGFSLSQAFLSLSFPRALLSCFFHTATFSHFPFLSIPADAPAIYAMNP